MKLTAFLSLGFISLAANGGVIFDNGAPNPNTGWPFSDFDIPQETADDFVLAPGENVLRDIHWWGGYGTSPVVPDSDDFTIRIFENDGTKPSETVFQSVVFQMAPGRSLIEDNTATIFDTYFEYWVDIEPITLAANTTYWLSIVNNMPGTAPNWL